MGPVQPCGRGHGQSDLRRPCVICRFSYSQVIGLGLREKGCEDLMFRRCQGGVGRGSRVGGQGWALAEWEDAAITRSWSHCVAVG